MDHLCWIALKGFAKNVDGPISKAAIGGVLLKKVFLEILEISQENTCVEIYSS